MGLFDIFKSTEQKEIGLLEEIIDRMIKSTIIFEKTILEYFNYTEYKEIPCERRIIPSAALSSTIATYGTIQRSGNIGRVINSFHMLVSQKYIPLFMEAEDEDDNIIASRHETITNMYLKLAPHAEQYFFNNNHTPTTVFSSLAEDIFFFITNTRHEKGTPPVLGIVLFEAYTNALAEQAPVLAKWNNL